MILPYSNARSGLSAMEEIQRILKQFGCSKFGHWQDYEKHTLTVQFEWRGKAIELTASAGGYAAAWLKENPWSSRRQATKQQWEQKAFEKGSVAVYSILRDWIKAQVTAIDTGLLTFESVFMPHMLLPDGKTMLNHLPKLLENKN